MKARKTVTKKIRVDAKAMRNASGLNQAQFWPRLGVTQSGGSRYENGRTMPHPLRMLAALHDGTASVDQLRSGQLAELV